MTLKRLQEPPKIYIIVLTHKAVLIVEKVVKLKVKSVVVYKLLKNTGINKLFLKLILKDLVKLYVLYPKFLLIMPRQLLH